MDKFGIVIAIFISILWGLNPILIKHIFKDVDLIMYLFYSNIFYFLCSLIFSLYYWNHIKTNIKIKSRSLFYIAINMIILVFITNLLYAYILDIHSKSSIISAVVYSAPLYSLIFAYFILNEKLSAYSIFGIFFIVTGLILIFVSSNK